MTDFSIETARRVLDTEMPGFVRDLGICVEAVGEGQARLRLPFSDRACREGGTFSGQALAALADTAMCFAIWTDGRGYRPVATVDLHVTYLRGGGDDDVIAHAELVRAGRSLAFARVPIYTATSGQTLATAVATFALPA
jgi:uncharacterized protein (TIGR00369 family)